MSPISKQTLAEFDVDLWQATHGELRRQEDHLELIASENYVSPYVLQAQGSVLTNKYAEGYPGKRYYGGCEYVDRVEQLAIDRAKRLFKADYANVQPHSGSQANAAALMALLEPGDCLLGMSLAHGGHLTHGTRVNFSGRFYHAVSYGVDAHTQLIDYEEVRQLARMHQPKLIIAGFSAYSRVADWQCFHDIAQEIGAYLMVDMAHVAGLVAAGLYPSPIPIADVVTSTTHKTLRGARGGLILAKSNPVLEKKLDAAVFPGLQGGALMHVIAGKAVTFQEALGADFVAYQKQVITNARVMADTLAKQGYKIVSGGTDTHMFLVDLSMQAITGKEAERVLGEAHITLNKNVVPNDTLSPFITSGIRIGTPALTTRGVGEQEARELAQWIAQILDSPHDASVLERVRGQVVALCQQFPVYSRFT